MATVNVPNFVKNMGHKIISYILNISEEDAECVLSSSYELRDSQTAVLHQFIEICRKLRLQGIDQTDVDFSIFHRLPNIFINDKHIFNIWHEEMGGKIEVIESNDSIVSLVNSIASKLYPLFLIKITGKPSYFNKMHHNISSTIYSLPEYKTMCKELLSDSAISKIFSHVGENEIETRGYYMASTGHGGDIQLASLPGTIVTNSFELMRMRGLFTLEAFAKAAEDTVNIIRSCAKGEVLNVPVFRGFNNVSLNDIEELQTEWGILRPYNEGITELAPNNTSSTNIDGKQHKLGFVLETHYPYKVNFNDLDEKRKWPKELEKARDNLDYVTESLGLCFALACDRNPPVGISSAWTMIFDPISQGTSLSWNRNTQSPVSHYILNSDTDDIESWSKILYEVEDTKIRLAIRRILSAINQRMDPIDGFIDTIIAWENLFGGNAELSFRISISIAKLLGNDDTERKQIQKLVADYYNKRSTLVHGVKEITAEEAIEYRDECLSIAIKSLKKLYLENVELIDDAYRSKTLALL